MKAPIHKTAAKLLCSSSMFIFHPENNYPLVFVFMTDYREFCMDCKEDDVHLIFYTKTCFLPLHKLWTIRSQTHSGHFLNPHTGVINWLMKFYSYCINKESFQRPSHICWHMYFYIFVCVCICVYKYIYI